MKESACGGTKTCKKALDADQLVQLELQVFEQVNIVNLSRGLQVEQ